MCVCICVCEGEWRKGGATSSEEAQVQPQTSPNDTCGRVETNESCLWSSSMLY